MCRCYSQPTRGVSVWHAVPDNVKVKSTDPRARLPRLAGVTVGELLSFSVPQFTQSENAVAKVRTFHMELL